MSFNLYYNNYIVFYSIFQDAVKNVELKFSAKHERKNSTQQQTVFFLRNVLKKQFTKTNS